MEIIQPKPLEKSQIKDWAGLPAYHEQWLRQIAEPAGLDIAKLVLGLAVESITCDDANSIYLIENNPPQVQRERQKDLLTRLNWEVSLPEMPDPLKSKIEKVIKKVQKADFGITAERDPAIAAWQELKQKFQDQIDSPRESPVSVAYIYYSLQRDWLVAKWNEYTQASA